MTGRPNDAENPLANVLASFDEGRATIAHSTLLGLLQVFGSEDATSIVDSLRGVPETHIAQLGKHPLICNMIMDVSQLAYPIANGRITQDDIRVRHNIATLVQMLTLSYESHGAPDDIVGILDAAYPPLFRRFLEAASSQVNTLCQYLLRIRDFLSKLSLAHSRIVIIELPIGNSLAVGVLKPILATVAPIEHVQVSLLRNDRAKFGITREDLLKERLNLVNLGSNDIILYLDEWNSGVNFNILCKLLSKIIAKRAFFLPCAILSSRASSFVRFDKFRVDHDAYLRIWGRDGSEFRQEFPALPLDGEFFWAENDRIAGWRKFQLHGAMFSTVNATIDILKNNPDNLAEAISLSLSQIARDKPLPSSPSNAFQTLSEMFHESCEVYESRREEFSRCADGIAAGGIVEDFGSALENMCTLYQEAGIEEGEEKVAIYLALTFMLRMGSVDPADRYYFKNHAPIIVKLDGRERRPHDLVMEYIESRLKQMGQ